jgi:hypothetical protein
LREYRWEWNIRAWENNDGSTPLSTQPPTPSATPKETPFTRSPVSPLTEGEEDCYSTYRLVSHLHAMRCHFYTKTRINTHILHKEEILAAVATFYGFWTTECLVPPFSNGTVSGEGSGNVTAIFSCPTRTHMDFVWAGQRCREETCRCRDTSAQDLTSQCWAV